MSIIMRSHFWLVLIASLLIITAVVSVYRVIRGPQIEYITQQVDRGNVREIVSVSGVIEAENTADLAFPTTGIIETINVKEGDEVAEGDILATLTSASLYADKQDAEAALKIAEANRSELISGPRTEARNVTALSVATAEANLERIKKEEDEKVKNAKRSLYSSNLQAFPVNKSTSNSAPTITGTYTCENSGQYNIEMYSSSAKSGYSYKLSGLENGIYGAYTINPDTMGNCGLRIQFPEGETFGSSDWIVPVPNQNGSLYATNLNTYELALENRDSAIASAREALELAQKGQVLENASPRSESLDRANANIQQALARLSSVDAAISDRTMRAPFAGTVTRVTARLGETVGAQPVVTLLSQDVFELTARIPEIDIAKINLGQKADVVFDAASDSILEATIIFISPIATEIDGVAYFEAKLKLTRTPTWLRSGLNADVDIVVKETSNTLRLPKRFVTTTGGQSSVLFQENKKVVSQRINTGLIGNDGYVEVIGLSEGTEVIAP